LSTERRLYRVPIRGASVVLGERTLVMGILNVTPDSFAGGVSLDNAVMHGLRLFEEGADWVDVGGESTRPGASPVPVEEERRRVVGVIEALVRRGAGPLSIDTTKAAVAKAALDAGADIVNDVSGFGYDPAMAALVAERGVPAVLMHLRGGFADVHEAPAYHDVMAEVKSELALALARAERAGVPRDRTLVDPGIGFSKDASHSLETLRRLPELQALDRPILVGPSRKSFIGRVLDLPVERRLLGTAAAVASCVVLGAHVVRVHDVREMLEVVQVCDAIRGSASGRAA
jgi:dihydropteroate synthase